MDNTNVTVLVVNLNNLEFTKGCILDLSNQDIVFNLRIVDQNSSEEGTKEYLDSLFENHLRGDFFGTLNYLEIINTGFNKPLNHIWNEFVDSIKTPFGCILNNDVRIAPNFLSSSLNVLEKESEVGFVSHVTNNRDYRVWKRKMEYLVMKDPYRQGWDFTFRKEDYHRIPDQLEFFYGDDYIFSKLYSLGKKGAYIINSPMIHFERSTTVEKGGIRDCSPDGEYFSKLDLEYKNLSFNENLSKWKPEFLEIEEGDSCSSYDDFLNKFSSDKGTNPKKNIRGSNGYGEIYSLFFSKIQKSARNICEIGIENGHSLLAAEGFFENASIHGIDIEDKSHLNSDRISTHRVDQSKKDEILSFREKMVSEGIEFDLIIDDGSHDSQHQQLTFGLLFDLIKPGGIYVIEDLGTSFYEEGVILYGYEQTKEKIENNTYKFLSSRPFCSPWIDKDFLNNLDLKIDSVTIFNKTNPLPYSQCFQTVNNYPLMSITSIIKKK